jgi:hypothetical protein
MPASPPASDPALLAAIVNTCWVLSAAATAVWSGVFAVRVRRLRRARREAAAEEELTGRVLDQISGYSAKSPGAGFDQLPRWKRGVLLRVLCRLIEQTKGRDQGQLVGLLRDAGFRDRALADLRQGTGLQRQDACTVLGYFDDEASTAGLRAALDDPDGAVRLTAARALLLKDHVTSLRELLNRLDFSREDPPLILAEIFGNLPARLHEEAVTLLREPLPPAWLRMLAIALARQQVLAAFEAVADLRRSPVPRVRAAAWVALHELGDPRAGDLVAEGLRDPSPDVRQAASRCAGRLGGPDVLPLLAALLRDPDWWTAFRAARALLATGPAGRALLEEHARTAPEDDAGRQALREQAEEDTLAD